MIETSKDIFDDEILNLMDFNCDQKDSVHFFYTLPFNKNKALIETTWLSDLEDQRLMDYDLQLENYIKYNLGIKNYKIKYFNAFNEDPSHLSLLSYDLVGLIYYLSFKSDLSNLNKLFKKQNS